MHRGRYDGRNIGYIKNQKPFNKKRFIVRLNRLADVSWAESMQPAQSFDQADIASVSRWQYR